MAPILWDRNAKNWMSMSPPNVLQPRDQSLGPQTLTMKRRPWEPILGTLELDDNFGTKSEDRLGDYKPTVYRENIEIRL